MIIAIWRGSLAYRAWSVALAAVSAAASGSLLARAARRMWRACLVAVHGSRFFALPAGLTGPVPASGEALSVQAVVRPYGWMRRVIGEGPLGRAARSVAVAPRTSLLADSGWAGLVGGAVLGCAIGRLGGAALEGPAALGAAAFSVAVLGLAAACAIVLFLRPDIATTSAPVRCAAALGTDAGHPGRFGATSRRNGAPGPHGSASRSWLRRTPVFWIALGLAVVAGAMAGAAGGGAVLLAAAAVLLAAGVFVSLVWPASLLVLLALFPWVNWGARSALAGSGLAGAVDDLMLLGSAAVLVVALTVTRSTDLRRMPILLPLLCAMVVALGSVVVNNVPADVALYALRVMFQPVLFFFLGYLLPRTRRWTRWIVAAFLLASLLLALHGLFQYATHAPMPKKWVDITETAIGTRAYSIIENPNGLGAFLLLGSFVAGSLTLAPLGRRLRLVTGAVTLVLLAGLAVTFSRGAWIGFVVGCFAFAALVRPRMFVGLVVAVCVAPFALPGMFLDRLTFAFSQAYLTKSLAAGRLLSWSLALQHIERHPWFGVGLGTFGGTTAFLFKYTRISIDNFYLQIAAEGGVLLLLCFLWMLWRVVKGLVASQRAVADPFTKALVGAAFAGFVAVSVANFTAGVWETLAVGVGFWFLMGFASSPLLQEGES